jgi:hypothetical protein
VDIAEFLAARLDEEQRRAEAAAKESSPRFDVDGKQWRNSDGEGIYCQELPLAVGPYGVLGDAFVSHVLAYDPARVLAEVAAKRAIVDLWEPSLPDGAQDGRDWNEKEADDARAYVLELALRHLASLYADHADFDPAWAIDAPH